MKPGRSLPFTPIITSFFSFDPFVREKTWLAIIRESDGAIRPNVDGVNYGCVDTPEAL